MLGNTAGGTQVGIGINAPTTIFDVRGSTNVVGVTTINTAGNNATTVGSVGGTGAIALRSNAAGSAITLDVANTANNLTINNIMGCLYQAINYIRNRNEALEFVYCDYKYKIIFYLYS